MSDLFSSSLPDPQDRNESVATGKRLGWFWRLRIQLSLLVLMQVLAVLVIFVVGLPFSLFSGDNLLTRLTTSTFLWSALASVLGYGIYRSLSFFPGMSKLFYISPSLLTSYSGVILALFLMRIDYSRFVILSNLIGGLAWLHFVTWVRGRTDVTIYGIVPIGIDRPLLDLPGANWKILKDPDMAIGDLDGIVADLKQVLPAAWERFVARCVLNGKPVFDLRIISELLTGRIQIDSVHENNFGSLLPSNLYLRVKRAIDLALAVLVLPIVIPIIVVAILAIKFESKGPAFFLQTRMGYRGADFTIYKLRSMRIEQDEGDAFTGEDDPRITRVGQFIRKYRIDELPQIFNVILGDMSWLGPRPEARQLAKWYESEIPFYMYRHAVRPGISGWAQVSQGNVAKIDAVTLKLQYDFFYIKYFSPSLDFLIILKTIYTILTGFGAR